MSFPIPVFAHVDLVVIGGSTGAVAAAVEAARAGRRVFLGAAENYLGADICGAGRWWLPDESPADHPLIEALYSQASKERPRWAAPLAVKRELDKTLLDAGVEFLFGCHPADLLVDASDDLSGVLFTSKSGPFAVTARQVIDATPTALAARMAGVDFTSWPEDARIEFRHVLVGHRAEGDDGSQGESLGVIHTTYRDEPVEAEAYRYRTTLPVPSFSPQAMADLANELKSRHWHRDIFWSSERLDWVPPDNIDTGVTYPWRAPSEVDLKAFETSIPGVHVLGPCAALSRADAANLLDATNAIMIGARLGRALAAIPQPEVVATGECRSLTRGAIDISNCEPALHLRPSPSRETIQFESGFLPRLGQYDVVVVGGGTGGAPAALAAARSGASVLLIESLHDLGGVSTLGCIPTYYHGNRAGFNQEMARGLHALGGESEPFSDARCHPVHKTEWLRREILAAGGKIWFNSVVSGARMSKQKITGVVVNTPWGRGQVKAEVVIDATGNADVAAAAGADCTVVSEHDLAIQGTGLPPRHLVPGGFNTDYTFIADDDIFDVTRSFIVARKRFEGQAFDVGQIPDTRERRQIVGDVTVTPLDVYTGRTWSDSICLSRSNFDSHGFTVHPLFVVLPPDRTSLDAWLPLRALLPKGIVGLMVTGLGLSAQRDVMPVLRMQPDVQNHAYAAGLAAVMALTRKGEVRRIDPRHLQRQLVTLGILPQTVLLHRDGVTLPRPVLQSAADGSLEMHSEVAALMSAPEPSRLLLRQRFSTEQTPETRLACARLLAILGDNCGAALLIERLRSSDAWDEGWNYTGMGQFGRSLSPLDDCIMALAMARVGEAKQAVIEKLRLLDGEADLSHVRAVSVYAESFPDGDFAEALAHLLRQPGMSGHAWTSVREELENIPPSTVDTTTRNLALRELYLARALWRCGDRQGLAFGILSRYAMDIRGHFARHARRHLATPPSVRKPRPRVQTSSGR